MTSDRTRELAKELYDKCICTKAGDIWNEEAAVALLDAFERETRLNEAKRWCHNWYGYDNLGLSGQALCHRSSK